jgi:hypothetical protein
MRWIFVYLPLLVHSLWRLGLFSCGTGSKRQRKELIHVVVFQPMWVGFFLLIVGKNMSRFFRGCLFCHFIGAGGLFCQIVSISFWQKRPASHWNVKKDHVWIFLAKKTTSEWRHPWLGDTWHVPPRPKPARGCRRWQRRQVVCRWFRRRRR